MFRYKKFDIKASKNGADVALRDGRDVKILYYDFYTHDKQCIVALIKDKDPDVEDIIYTYNKYGEYNNGYDEADMDLDLIMKPYEIKGYINLYINKECPLDRNATTEIFNTEAEAKAAGINLPDYYTTVEITYPSYDSSLLTGEQLIKGKSYEDIFGKNL